MRTGNEITETDVQSDGIVGKLYRPVDKKVCPGIIVLGGSGGGFSWPTEMGARLARHGFATLALAYFRHGNLPKTLVHIRLEYFEAAINWISGQEEVTATNLAVVGASRGGELALILASTFPQIKAVVAYAPSSVVWGACGGITSVGRAAWTHHGRPLPHMKMRLSPKMLVEYVKMGFCFLSRRPFRETPLFVTALDKPSSVEQAVIHVERICGPILLISGDDDQIWPSDLMCKMIVKRLGACGYPFSFRHLSYEGAGHAISFPDLPSEAYAAKVPHPLTRIIYELGGDPEKTAQASKSAWTEVVAFLEKYVAG